MTNLGHELAQHYRTNALREIATHARAAEKILKRHARSCGTSHKSEANAHYADARQFQLLALYTEDMIRMIEGSAK